MRNQQRYGMMDFNGRGAGGSYGMVSHGGMGWRIFPVYRYVPERNDGDETDWHGQLAALERKGQD